ncbi:MAG: hypothetical protein ACRD5K_13040 [Candidatus Acidiferrales bacterium]
MKEVDKIQADYVRERDTREFDLGDTLDVKTSVILAVIVFLAAQSGDFFKGTLTPRMRHLQYLSVAALILAGIFAVAELVPRNYGTEASPSRYQKWVSELDAYYAGEDNADALVADEAVRGRCQRAMARVDKNIEINKQKSLFLSACFIFTAVSLAANLITLAIHLF